MVPESITCPVCDYVSHNPGDVTSGWCAHCNTFTQDTLLARQIYTNWTPVGEENNYEQEIADAIAEGRISFGNEQ